MLEVCTLWKNTMPDYQTPEHLKHILSKYDAFLAAEVERLKNQPRQFPDQEPNDLFGELCASLSKAHNLNFVQSADTVFDYCRRNAIGIPLPTHASELEPATAHGRKWWQFWHRQKDKKEETGAVRSKYRVGQVWSYKTRPQEIGSTLTIVQIEAGGKLGNIVHISVQGLEMENPQVASGRTSEFQHLPMAEEAIDNSVVKMLNENANLPNYPEGYKEWRQAFDAHRAGIFTITVAECIDIAEKAIKGHS